MRRTAVLAVATAATAAFGVGLALRPAVKAPHRSTVVDQVRDELAANYYQAVPKEVLRRPTVDAILGALHDRYTTYLTPAEYRVARRAFAGGYGGIGATVLPAPGGLLVRRIVPGPARVAGMRPGDTILAVDGASTAGLPFDEAMGRIIGRPGTRVRLRVLRAERTLRFTVVRRVFRLAPVHARLVGKVGVIDLNAFSRSSSAATAAAVRRLARAGATAFVLDLRGNPGGLLAQAVKLTSLFLRPGASIVSLAGAHRPLRIVYASGGQASSAPLVVLIDRGSASASEVVAGALKDHGRATLVGQRTFGKSLVQDVVRLPSGAALKLTVARYLTPAGIDISREGVQPDVRSRHALAAALRLLETGRRS